jgi:hypothetical protein
MDSGQVNPPATLSQAAENLSCRFNYALLGRNPTQKQQEKACLPIPLKDKGIDGV